MDTLLKYTHELVMFVAVALSIGATTLLFRLRTSSDVAAIRAVFVLFRPLGQAIGPVYGLGTLLGLATVWAMGLNFLSLWLLGAYAITLAAAVLGEVQKGWIMKVARLAEAETGTAPGPELKAALASRTPVGIRLFDMVILAVIVALMVFRPQ